MHSEAMVNFLNTGFFPELKVTTVPKASGDNLQTSTVRFVFQQISLGFTTSQESS